MPSTPLWLQVPNRIGSQRWVPQSSEPDKQPKWIHSRMASVDSRGGCFALASSRAICVGARGKGGLTRTMGASRLVGHCEKACEGSVWTLTKGSQSGPLILDWAAGRVDALCISRREGDTYLGRDRYDLEWQGGWWTTQPMRGDDRRDHWRGEKAGGRRVVARLKKGGSIDRPNLNWQVRPRGVRTAHSRLCVSSASH